MPLGPMILGRSFLGHTATRRPLPDVARGLSGDRDVAVPIMMNRIAEMARRDWQTHASGERGHWTGFRIADVVVEVGGASAVRSEIKVKASGRLVLRLRSRVGGDGVRRFEIRYWNRGMWQRKLFRRSVRLPSTDA